MLPDGASIRAVHLEQRDVPSTGTAGRPSCRGAGAEGREMAQGVRGTRPMAECPTCGKSFWLPPSYAKRHVSFCSKACRSAPILRLQLCRQCGRVMRSTVGKPRRYCSVHCTRVASRRATWPPCAVCGDPKGYVRKGAHRPVRMRGAPYGLEGEVCWTCYCRLRRQLKSRGGGELPAAPCGPPMQRDA